MKEPAFDIYESARGYAAVTNGTRRRILLALKVSDADLPALVRLTGKSKPTLSSIHMRALLDDGLVEEHAHPSDARRKLYHLTAKRIGASDVPLEELRGAVHEYTRRDARGPVVALGTTLDIVSADGTPAAVMHAQAKRLGEASASYATAETMQDALPSIARVLDRAGVARAQCVDFETNEIELEPLGKGPADLRVLAGTIAAFFEGVLQAHAHEGARVTSRVTAQNRIVVTIAPLRANISR